MARLADLVDKEDAISIRPVATELPVVAADPNDFAPDTTVVGSKLEQILNRLTGANGVDRYQLWPEKVVREGLSAAGDVLQEGTLPAGLRREDITDIPAPQMPTKDSTWLGRTLNIAPVAAEPSDKIIEQGQAMSALAGSGGLAGTTDATLGAGPFLRPALKHEGKIYKAPMNGQHLDALPEHLAQDFQTKAMSGEDISHYDFGFMNHKGQFLNREKALEYAIEQGLVDQQAVKYGALTSTLLADSSKPGTAIEAMAKTGQPFYSALEHNVNQISQTKMNGEAWLGTLANKPGVKPEELDWTGLKSFLEENKGKPVTKAQIQEHLEQNKVELKEVQKGGEAGTKEAAFELAKEHGWKSWDEIDPATQAKYIQRVSKEAGENPTKYHKYQLPGGENYREMLLTLPRKDKAEISPVSAKKQALEEHGYEEDDYHTLPDDELASVDDRTAELLKDRGKPEAETYRSSHWDEPNILAHVRMNDRYFDNPNIAKPKPLTDADYKRYKELGPLINKALDEGKDVKALMNEQNEIGARIEGGKDLTFTPNRDKLKSLHLEEIQSDWHQQGRDKGYAIDQEKLQEKYDDILKQQRKIEKDKYLENREANIEKYDALEKQRQEVEAQQRNAAHSVPDAPFKKTWHELALKRMLREAAEKGYDRLSWTPGEAQAARYDLSKQVNLVSGMKQGDKYNVYIEGKDGHALYRNQNGFSEHGQKTMTEQELKDTIGKEAAEKIINGKPNKEGWVDLRDNNLKVGGEGMKGFYDQIIPKSVNKLAKEYGAQVKLGKTKEGHDVHYIDLPQKLKDVALNKGFPLFSSGVPGYQFIPVDHDPFEKKKK